MSINLVIEDIGVRDAGKGIARITEKKMQDGDGLIMVTRKMMVNTLEK